MDDVGIGGVARRGDEESPGSLGVVEEEGEDTFSNGGCEVFRGE